MSLSSSIPLLTSMPNQEQKAPCLSSTVLSALKALMKVNLTNAIESDEHSASHAAEPSLRESGLPRMKS